MTAPVYVTGCDQRVIDTRDGAVEYLWIDITDQNKQDLSTATVEISLGTHDTPGTWQPASSVQVIGGDNWRIRAGLLIGGSYDPPSGSYWAWSRTHVGPEMIVQRASNMTVTIIA